jgi:hypothetical protein
MWAAVRRYEGVTDPAEAGRLDWVRENAAALLPNAPQVIEGHVVATATKK